MTAVTVSIMPDTVDTVIGAPDDGWRYHPKHVEQFADINKLYIVASCWIIIIIIITITIPLALQPTMGFGLSNNELAFFPICHQLSPSSHSQHLKISFYFLFLIG